MLDIDKMGQDEVHELLHKVGNGHLGFIHEGKPCVMPMSRRTTDGASSHR